MRVKTLIEKVLRPFPAVYRLGSRVYHATHWSFRSSSAEAPDAIRRALTHVRDSDGTDPGDYYEFGLFRGFTFLTAYQEAASLGLKEMRFYGFDSFEGLPEVEESEVGEGQFFKGQFACSRDAVEANLRKHGVDFSRATLVEGYYENTLTEDLRSQHSFRRAACVTMDCDLYSSTRDALCWLTPYLEDKTVVIFDDWRSYGGDPEQGQPRAWQEWLAANPGMESRSLFTYRNHGEVFELVAR